MSNTKSRRQALSSVHFVKPTMIDLVVKEWIKADKFEIHLLDDVVQIKNKSNEQISLVPLSNVAVMIKA